MTVSCSPDEAKRIRDRPTLPISRTRIALRSIRATKLKTGGLHLPFDHRHLDLGDGFRRIEMFRAGLRAIHDGMAAVEAERVLQVVEPVAGRLVTRIHDPALRLQQCGGAEIAIRVPPVARA